MKNWINSLKFLFQFCERIDILCTNKILSKGKYSHADIL